MDMKDTVVFHWYQIYIWIKVSSVDRYNIYADKYQI
jgi:hypothetical protein